MAMTVVAAYDVAHDSRRARLAAMLQAYGDRLQKSVFVLQVDASEIDDIERRAGQILDADQDGLFLLPVCSACWESQRTVGQAQVPEPDLLWVVV